MNQELPSFVFIWSNLTPKAGPSKEVRSSNSVLKKKYKEKNIYPPVLAYNMLNKLLGGSHSRFWCVQLLTFMVWLMTMSVNNKVKFLLPFPYISEWILMLKHSVPLTWDKNVFHNKDITLAKAPFHCSPCMSMGKICADQVSQNCFLYSPRRKYKIFCVNKQILQI